MMELSGGRRKGGIGEIDRIERVRDGETDMWGPLIFFKKKKLLTGLRRRIKTTADLVRGVIFLVCIVWGE